jgi:hypothetical protein
MSQIAEPDTRSSQELRRMVADPVALRERLRFPARLRSASPAADAVR